ncbi:MAG: transcriptional repressor [Myxococcales bacterium]|nr:transcriptional repressor [Myxococcales bacterium]
MDRQTNQRRAIRAVFREQSRPLDPREVLLLAGKTAPQLGLATVYRTIKALLAEGFLVPVITPKGSTSYEIAGKSHHHHFHCRHCGKAFEVPGCVGQLARLVPPGFVLEDHELLLYGRCLACREQAVPGKRNRP